MMAINHLLVVLILIKLLKLDRNQAFVAILFGVLIDLDHLMGIPAYIADHGWMAVVSIDTLLHNDVQWKSAMHGGEALLVVLAVSMLLRMYAPLLFWGIHISMDWMQTSFWGITSWPEFVSMAALALVFGVMMWDEHRITCPEEPSSRSYASYMCSLFVDMGTDMLPLRRIPEGFRSLAGGMTGMGLIPCHREPPRHP